MKRTPGTPGAPTRRPVLYVEGPRDRDILLCWVRRLSPGISRAIDRNTVILGGRRPARALSHFREAGGKPAGLRALCVLDRDESAEPGAEALANEPGVELFTWPRRHIESYLLVPAAIHRSLRNSDGIGEVERALRAEVPDPSDEAAMQELDAKRLITPRGALGRGLGSRLSAAAIARSMRTSEIHRDVHRLVDRLQATFAPAGDPVVVVRKR